MNVNIPAKVLALHVLAEPRPLSVRRVKHLCFLPSAGAARDPFFSSFPLPSCGEIGSLHAPVDRDFIIKIRVTKYIIV